MLGLLRPDAVASGIVAALFLTHTSSLLEKDFRDLWAMYDSFKSSDSLLTDLVHSLPVPLFVMSQQSEETFTNRSAQMLLRDLDVSQRALKEQGLCSIVDSASQDELRTMMHQVLGSKSTADFECSSTAPHNGNARVTLKLKIAPQNWITDKAVLVTCRPKSDSTGKHEVITQLTKMVLPTSKFLTQEFKRKLKHNDYVRKEDLLRLHRLDFDLQGLHLISAYYSRKLETKRSIFSLVNEVKNSIEFASLKAFRRQVDVKLKIDNPIPQFVSAERTTYDLLINSLINFAVDNANPETTIELRLISLVDDESFAKVHITHTLSFVSDSLSREEFSRSFISQDNSVTPEALKEAFEAYGVYLAVLKVLLCFLPLQQIQAFSTEQRKFTVSFGITAGVFAQHGVARDVKMTEASVSISPGTIHWQAPDIDEASIKLQPTSPSHDGSAQLSRQITGLRQGRKALSLGAADLCKAPSLKTSESMDDCTEEALQMPQGYRA
jgi:hypothetical protein